MAEKNLKARIVHKHDIEANWLLATGFTPKQGEIIVYDIDDNYSYERIKIGDGVQNVNNLPFADAHKVDKVSGKGLSTNDYTTTEKNKLAGIAEGANKTIVDSALSSTSTNPVQNKVVNTAISNLNTLVGDKSVADQISDAHKNIVTVEGGASIAMESAIGSGPYDIEITTDGGELDWLINTGVATGGTTGQILVKKSNTDFDTSWVDAGAYVGVKVYTATIGTIWTENTETGVRSQTVAINGVTANNTAKVDVVYSGNGTSASYAAFVAAKNQFLDYITNGYAETVAGGVKFNIFGDPNTVEIPIIVEVV